MPIPDPRVVLWRSVSCGSTVALHVPRGRSPSGGGTVERMAVERENGPYLSGWL